MGGTHMRISLLTVSMALLLTATVADAAGDKDSSIIVEFITDYHRDPAAGRVPEVLDLVLTGKFLDDPQFETSNGHVVSAHSFGHMARGNPKLVRLYESRFDGASKQGR